MFDEILEFDVSFIESIKNKECLPPEGYKLSEDESSVVRKTEDEILADDWNSSLERKCEYKDYLEWSIQKMETYLTDTDWYVSRKAETGKDIPIDVQNTRIEYREKISDFRERLEEVPDEGDIENGTDSSLIS